MQILTPTLKVRAEARVVYEFLSDLANLAVWTSEFAARMEQTAAGWEADTWHGRLAVDVTCNREWGVIDLYVGPTRDRMGVCPVRVLALPGGGSLITVTMIQPDDLPDALFAIQYRMLLVELRGLARRFDGELFAAMMPETTMAA